jgi:hypothetical protein
MIFRQRSRQRLRKESQLIICNVLFLSVCLFTVVKLFFITQTATKIRIIKLLSQQKAYEFIKII